jgi:hypothetical protein
METGNPEPAALSPVPPPARRGSFAAFIFGAIIGVGLTLFGFWCHSVNEGPQAHLAGVWTGTAEVAGTEVALSLNLQSKGNTFSGELNASPGGEASFDSLTVDPAGDISFSIQVASETVSFTGKVDPKTHSMAGKMSTTSYGDGTWSLTKAS